MKKGSHKAGNGRHKLSSQPSERGTRLMANGDFSCNRSEGKKITLLCCVPYYPVTRHHSDIIDRDIWIFAEKLHPLHGHCQCLGSSRHLEDSTGL